MADSYFEAKAREVFAAAGGEPAHTAALAAWAEAVTDPIHGVLVGQDGTILGETVHSRRGAPAAHITGDTSARWGLRGSTTLDLALGAISRAAGQPVIHLTRTELTRGAGRFIRDPARAGVSGAEIAATRVLLGLSQTDLATALGVSRQSVKDWERGRFTARPGVIADLDALRRQHDTDTTRLITAAKSGIPIEIPSDGARPQGWYLGVAARVLDQVPAAHLDWAPDDTKPA